MGLRIDLLTHAVVLSVDACNIACSIPLIDLEPTIDRSPSDHNANSKPLVWMATLNTITAAEHKGTKRALLSERISNDNFK